MPISYRGTNNYPESGRGLGQVTPTIFGSTVGYPSDSLASCLFCQRFYLLKTFIEHSIKKFEKHF